MDDLTQRLRGAVRLLPERIVLQKSAVTALLDSEDAERGRVSLDMRSLAGLPGGVGASYVLKGAAAACGSIDFGQVIDRAVLERGRRNGLVLKVAAYDLCLVPADETEPALVTALRGAHAPEVAGGGAVAIPWNLVEKEKKQDDDVDYSWLSRVYGLGPDTSIDDFLQLPFPESRIATGGVLQPETPDSTVADVKVDKEGLAVDPNDKDPGTKLKAKGDVYDAVQIKRAMRFWMAYTGGRTTIGHVRLGGWDPQGDVRVLENYQTRSEFAFEDGSVPRVGTWVLSNWFPGDAAWEKIEKGEHKAYSLGSWFQYVLEKA